MAGGIAKSMTARSSEVDPREHKHARGLAIPPMPPEPEKGSQSGVDVIRGSSDIPLNAEGEAQAKDLRKRLEGKVTCIYTSPLERAKETAEEIGKGNPKAMILVRPQLMPWKLGKYEGQPTSEVLKDMRDMILNRSGDVPPGKGPKSTASGESFDTFRKRVLVFIKSEIDEHKAQDVDLYSTHYRIIKLLEAWEAAGHPDDMHVDKSVMVTHSGKEEPGDLFLFTDKKLKPVKDIAEPGMYFVRHGKTAWNGAS